MLFGVEQECFVFNAAGGVPANADIDAFYQRLQACGFWPSHWHSESGQVLAASKSTDSGQLRVSNDFATHLVEVAFPPLEDLTYFKEAYEEAFSQVAGCLDASELLLMPSASLASLPASPTLRASPTDPTGDRLRVVIQRPATDSPHFDPLFPAAVAATHVHCDIKREQSISLLPRLQCLDWIVPFAFSQSADCLGLKAHCARALCYLENFLPPEQECGRDQKAPPPETPTYQDRSYISAREKTIEFRSADSQPDADSIGELVSLRIAMIAAAQLELPEGKPEEDFRQACHGVPANHWEQHLAVLSQSIENIPQQHHENVASTIQRVRDLARRFAEDHQCEQQHLAT